MATIRNNLLVVWMITAVNLALFKLTELIAELIGYGAFIIVYLLIFFSIMIHFYTTGIFERRWLAVQITLTFLLWAISMAIFTNDLNNSFLTNGSYGGRVLFMIIAVTIWFSIKIMFDIIGKAIGLSIKQSRIDRWIKNRSLLNY